MPAVQLDLTQSPLWPILPFPVHLVAFSAAASTALPSPQPRHHAVMSYTSAFFGAKGSIAPLIHLMIGAGVLGYVLEYSHLQREWARGRNIKQRGACPLECQQQQSRQL